MKYRRKKVVELEAYFVESSESLEVSGLPAWVVDSVIHPISNQDFEIFTLSGCITVRYPIWLIREQGGTGAYPVSVEYFEENFEAVE